MVKRARKTDALTLPAGKADTALSDVRAKAIMQFCFDEVEYLRHSTSLPQSGVSDLVVRQTKRDVARNRIVDQKNFLWHITNGSLPGGHQARCERLPIDQDLACRRVVQTKQQINES